jgi:glycogen debranching enzyme
MPIRFDRNICCDLNETISREWLVTNGLGGYAAGTVAGVLTRMQHGLLVTMPPETVTPQLLLAKIDEEVYFDERTYYLGTNEYRDGTLNPAGFVHLESFSLEEGIPIFTYRLGGLNGIMLEKRIWMPYGLNTTCIQYRVLRTMGEGARYHNPLGSQVGYGRYQGYAEAAPRMLTLTLLPFSAHRPHTVPQQGNNDWHFLVEPLSQAALGDLNEAQALSNITGCTIRRHKEDSSPYYLLASAPPESKATFLPTGVWYWNFLRRHDAAAGLPATDDLYLPGVFRTMLWPGENNELILIASTEPLSTQQLSLNHLKLSYKRSVERVRRLFSLALQPQRFFGEGGEAARAHSLRVLPLTTTPDPQAGGEEYLHQLLQAADRFLVSTRRPYTYATGETASAANQAERVPLLVANYYNMDLRVRDMLIALPGLTLVTGQYDAALKLLRELERTFRGGLLPDTLPTNRPLRESDYGNVDNTLWFFYALDCYLRTTRNYTFLEEIYYRLTECIEHYVQGTSRGIRVDARDGLLYACSPGQALTWMNARVNGVPLTERGGKAVEVNALWYYVLSLMHEWSQYMGQTRQQGRSTAFYEHLLEQCRQHFQRRYWNTDGYLYDVIDGVEGDDAAIRPNQLFALSLRYPVLDISYHQGVIDVVTHHLLTPYGLRTLAPNAGTYCGSCGERQQQQEYALHQGSAWTWLLGPYIEAMLNVPPNDQLATSPNGQLYQEYLWRKSLRLLEPFKEAFNHGLLEMSSGIYDGNAPHTPSCGSDSATSALATATLLSCYDLLARVRISQPERILSF